MSSITPGPTGPATPTPPPGLGFNSAYAGPSATTTALPAPSPTAPTDASFSWCQQLAMARRRCAGIHLRHCLWMKAFLNSPFTPPIKSAISECLRRPGRHSVWTVRYILHCLSLHATMRRNLITCRPGTPAIATSGVHGKRGAIVAGSSMGKC